MTMSDMRKKGIEYLKKVYGYEPLELIAVSKFYEAEESWTKKQTWWFDLPIKKIESKVDEDYYLMCEYRNDKFVVLRIPNRFLLDNRDRFDTKSANVIRFHLAAYPENWLVDERVDDGVDFSQFELK